MFVSFLNNKIISSSYAKSYAKSYDFNLNDSNYGLKLDITYFDQFHKISYTVRVGTIILYLNG